MNEKEKKSEGVIKARIVGIFQAGWTSADGQQLQVDLYCVPNIPCLLGLAVSAAMFPNLALNHPLKGKVPIAACILCKYCEFDSVKILTQGCEEV
jgi:hypothetical protein